MTTIVWFRQDLRIGDNPALAAAGKHGPVVPLYILDEEGRRPLGAASRWWLHHSLTALEENLGGLVLRRGDPAKALLEIAKTAGADRIVWNRCHEPDAIARDEAVVDALAARGIAVEGFNGNLLHEPTEVKTKTGGPFKVYTPFWRACRARQVAPPQRAAQPNVRIQGIVTDTLASWKLLPTKPNWAAGWSKYWTPGEKGAHARLDAFVRSDLKDYATARDRMAGRNTSLLSPHLHFGEISPRQVFARIAMAGDRPGISQAAAKFEAELGWREFCAHLLYHFPTIATDNWRTEFDKFPWQRSAAHLKAWQRGRTGYPMVDAGMRELWTTGWMHNRVRMIVASFLVKHLRMHWRDGEAWFWDTLVDADLANNAGNWQWVAGSGADASPYFRIFNPMIQGEKFDPDGAYVRRWCPELKNLPDKFIHAPFDAGADVLENAGIKLGRDYPKPVVDHAEAREAALAAYKKITR
ncbi:MAG: cryptochrome/photolyase family protein [Pseudolabrys sp.]